MNAKFDKFSTLGLDYKPAFKSSDDYISFLIKRDDTTFNIPLSEMKLFLKRDKAEKFIDLKTNDEIQIKGKVFSDALGDAWIDVEELTVTKKAPDENNGK
jgi:lysyl-tRNA synthetase class II